MEKEELMVIVREAVGSAVGACLERFTLPTMFTVDEVAEKCKVSRDIVNQYVKTGELPSVLLGARMVRISAENVRLLLDALKQKAEADVVPEVKPEPVPEVVPEVKPEPVQEDVPEKEAEDVQEVKPEVVPEKEAEVVPEKEAEVVPEKEAEAVPEVKPEPVPEEIHRCPARHPKTGARCVLEEGHEGKHKLEEHA